MAAFLSSKQLPALDELENFIFCRLAAKIPVTDSFYNGLVAHNDAIKDFIEPSSESSADTLAALVVAALFPPFAGGNEIVIAGIPPLGCCMSFLSRGTLLQHNQGLW